MSDLHLDIVKPTPAMPQPAGPPLGRGPVVDPTMVRFSALSNYVDVALKQRWLILSIAAVVTVLVALYSFVTKPVYRATASLELESETPLVQSLTDLFRANGALDEETFLSTQVDVIQSANIAWRTIQQTKLAKEREFKALVDKEPALARSPSALQTALMEEFKKHLVVDRQRGTRMIKVHFDSSSPTVSAAVANGVVDNYIEYSFRLKYDATRQATQWMEQQLNDLKNKVQDSQQKLVDYEAKNSILNVGEKESVAEQTLADLSKDLTEAQDDRVRKESLVQVVSADPAKVRFVAQSPLLQKLQESQAELNTQYADASQSYGQSFPKVRRLQAQLDEVKSLVATEQQRIIEAINHDYSASRVRERLLADAVGKQKEEVTKLNELEIQHNLLKHDFESNQELYNNLMQRMKEATVSAGLRATNIHMIDRALPPAKPARPRKVLNIVLGLVAGLILGFLCALILEAMDYSIKGAEEIEALTGIPTLSIVPSAGSASTFLARRSQKHISGNGNVAITVLRHPESAVAEAFRALRTSVLLSQAGRPPQVILVTSSGPGEGKSCTAVNLALTLAQKNGRTLMVDADFRRASVANGLGIANDVGLSNVLSGASALGQAVVQCAELPSLWILPSGPRPPNPSELLSSAAMDDLLKEVRPHYATIIIDSPPVLLITDSSILASLVDGVVMVAESERTTRSAIARAVRIISLSGGRVLGAVLNKVDIRRDGYSGHYNYYYRETYDKYYVQS